MFKLRAKFFSIIFVVNVLLLAGTYAYLYVSFNRTFDDYIIERSREVANGLAVRLEEHYQMFGGWSDIAIDDQAWVRFVFRSARPYFRPRRDVGPQPTAPNPSLPGQLPPPEPIRNRPVPPLFLLDANGELLVGNQGREGEFTLRELSVNNQIVGYLGIPLNLQMRDYVDNQLASKTMANYAKIVLMALLVAFVTAIPLSLLMVSRIRRLVGQVQNLSRGDYSSSLKLSGQDELKTLAEHLNDLGRSLEKSEKQRNQWVADISHELRTPVAILQADLEAMEDGVRELDHKAVQRLSSQTQRLKNLVNDLHNLSLSDVGSLTYRKEKCGINEVLEDTVESLRNQFEQKGIELHYRDLTSKAAVILADRQRLTQLYLNLLRNSLNYTDTPGQCIVTLRTEDNSVVTTISDSAPGVDQKSQTRLTERLFRVESSRSRDNGGAGLGLSICANIVEAHGGSLAFSDSPLGGLLVTASFPLSNSTA